MRKVPLLGVGVDVLLFDGVVHGALAPLAVVPDPEQEGERRREHEREAAGELAERHHGHHRDLEQQHREHDPVEPNPARALAPFVCVGGRRRRVYLLKHDRQTVPDDWYSTLCT
jgi:hypothetical protein